MQSKFNFEKYFIYIYILNLIHILCLIKNLLNIDINIKAFINYFYTQINKNLLISFNTFRDLREFDN